MATEKQIAANRRNAQKSTGPKTAEGKFKVRFNAVKHGMTASAAVLPFEDANSYDELRQALMDDYHPANSREHMLVEMIAVNYWRLLRARRVEVASFDLNIQTLKRRNGMSQVSSPDDDNALAVAFVNEQNVFRNIERYTEATERAYYRAIDTLRRLQNDREKREKIGFVSPPPPKARTVASTPSPYGNKLGIQVTGDSNNPPIFDASKFPFTKVENILSISELNDLKALPHRGTPDFPAPVR